MYRTPHRQCSHCPVCCKRWRTSDDELAALLSCCCIGSLSRPINRRRHAPGKTPRSTSPTSPMPQSTPPTDPPTTESDDATPAFHEVPASSRQHEATNRTREDMIHKTLTPPRHHPPACHTDKSTRLVPRRPLGQEPHEKVKPHQFLERLPPRATAPSRIGSDVRVSLTDLDQRVERSHEYPSMAFTPPVCLPYRWAEQ
jgi:hypothetical protein